MSATSEHRMDWQGIALSVRVTRPFLNTGYDHLELETSGRVPLPVTATGYRSHFMPSGILEDDPCEQVRAWLDHEAAKDTGCWRSLQLALF